MGDRELIVASRNQGKIAEIQAILKPMRVVGVCEVVPAFHVEERGETFRENARIKALSAFEATGRAVVADDSGLCVVGLGLEPGVRSYRYAGEGRSDRERVDFLLERMLGLEGEQRDAWFSCCVFAVLPASWCRTVEGATCIETALLAGRPGWMTVEAEGRLYGRIAHAPVGSWGFGYDPIFLPRDDPSGRTLAQYSLEEKNAVSHRGRAFALLRAALT